MISRLTLSRLGTLTAALLLAASFSLHAQTISTFAGTGLSAFSGDGSAATAASLSGPTGIVYSAGGDVYFADAGNYRIRKVSAGGTISTVAGSGIAGNTGNSGLAILATFQNIAGLALNAGGNILYVADAGAASVRSINLSTGIILPVAGTGLAGFSGDNGLGALAQLNTPMGLAMDGSGNLLIADKGNNRIRKVTIATGIINTIAGTGGSGSTGNSGLATNAQINGPAGVTVAPSGIIYLSEQNGHRVRKISTAGIISAVAGTGTAGSSGINSLATIAQLSSPTGLATDADGSLYIADAGNHAIRKITGGSVIIMEWAGNGTAGFSGDGGPAQAAQLSNPRWVASTTTGALAIADQANNRLRATTCAIPAAPGVVNGPAAGCTGTSYNFSIDPVDNAAYYNWTLPAGYTGGGTVNNIFITPGPGNGVISVAAVNSCGTSATTTKNFTNNTPTGIITALGPTDICTGGNVVLEAPAGMTTYQWKRGATNVSGGTNQTLTATLAGSYTVIVTANGCTATLGPVVVTVSAPPTASITASGPTTFCSDQSVTLTTTAMGTYQWKRNNADVPGANSASYNPVQTGSYKVFVSNPGNCNATSNAIAVTVNPVPTPVIAAVGGNTAMCTAPINLTSTGSGTGTRSWELGGNPVGASGNTYSATVPGTYSFTITTAAGCSATSAPLVITQGYIPDTSVIVASGPTQICFGDSVILSANQPGNTYQWYFANTPLAGATSETYTATVTGNYKVRVYGAGGPCFTTSNPISVTVNTTPNAAIQQVGTQTICFGTTIQLKGVSVLGATYQWLLNGSPPPTGGVGVNYTTSVPGTYTLQVTTGACSNISLPVTLIVEPLPTAVVTTLGNDTVCQGDSMLLSVGVGPGYTYQWYYYNDSISGATSPLYLAGLSGDYKVVVTNPTGCKRTSNVFDVTQVPAAYSQITYASPLEFCEGGAVVLTASAGVGDTVKWQWMLDYFPLTGDTGTYLIAEQTGLYTLETTNEFGCATVSGPIAITAHPHPEPVLTLSGGLISAPDSFASYSWLLNGDEITGAATYNIAPIGNGAYQVTVVDQYGCDGTSEVLFIIDGVSAETLSAGAGGIRMFPNPASAQVQVQSVLPVSTEILSMDGRVVSRAAAATTTTLDVRDLAAGQYLVVFRDAQGQVVKAERLVKAGG